ncbi:MAG: hypothetical protein BJ554DRAFT_820 [Olpidium bornovanus]|uniref:Uncharacterized protein n=1 Tax=Olpidium bornovanus TaxID=278681 RepID=A0A8H7ZT76_9FUNG|nr:MAG: hypothetical protein BJ554DRAFT_820 [Olpidium bornovanus]
MFGDTFTWSLLHAAAYHGNSKAVKLLMTVDGADVEARDTWYQGTPLAWAAFSGHEPVCRLLIEVYGASPHTQNSKGQVPADLLSDPNDKRWRGLLFDVRPRQGLAVSICLFLFFSFHSSRVARLCSMRRSLLLFRFLFLFLFISAFASDFRKTGKPATRRRRRQPQAAAPADDACGGADAIEARTGGPIASHRPTHRASDVRSPTDEKAPRNHYRPSSVDAGRRRRRSGRKPRRRGRRRRSHLERELSKGETEARSVQ